MDELLKKITVAIEEQKSKENTLGMKKFLAVLENIVQQEHKKKVKDPYVIEGKCYIEDIDADLMVLLFFEQRCVNITNFRDGAGDYVIEHLADVVDKRLKEIDNRYLEERL